MSKIPQEAIELLPCPFCGSEEIYMEPDEYGSGGQWVLPISVGCCVCGVDIGCVDAETEDEAATVWNKRYEAADAARAQGAEVEPFAWACRDYADGWIIYEDKKKATEYQEETSCLMIPVYTTPPAPKSTDREKVLEERLQAIIDWADLAIKNADEFDSHGVRNLDGPVFDAARAALAGKAPSQTERAEGGV